MPHNDYSFRNVFGQPPGTTVPSPAVLRQLDQLASQGIDGDNGGTWNPANPIIIGGAGLQIASQGTFNAVSTGPQAAPRAIILPNDQSILFGTTRNVVAIFPIRDFLTRVDEQAVPLVTSSVASTQQAYDESTPNGTKFSLTFNSATTRWLSRLPWFRVPIASSVQASLRMRVGSGSLLTSAAGGVATPSAMSGMPGFRITRVLVNGTINTTSDVLIPAWQSAHLYNVGDLVIPTTANGRQFRCSVAGTSGGSQPATFTSATTGASVTDNTVTWICELGPASSTSAHYFTLPLPATAALYYAAGQYQDISLPPNVAATASLSTGDYLSAFILDILDKSNSQNTYHSLKLTFGVNSFNPQL